MNEPKVTVFLSTYNQVKYVHKALDSIFMQEMVIGNILTVY